MRGSRLTQIGRGGLLALAIALAALLLWGGSALGTAHAQEAGMSLTVVSGGQCSGDTCTITGDASFVLAVMADPAPGEEISGFNTEVLFPEGMQWNQRTDDNGDPDCAAEVHVSPQEEGTEFGTCQSFVSSILGGAGNAVLTQITFPLPALNVAPGSTTTLVELDFTCTGVGVGGILTMALTANPPSDEGSLYSNLEAVEVLVATTTTFDVDGEPMDVADTLDIDCGAFGAVTGPVTGTGPIGPGGANVALYAIVSALVAAGAVMGTFGWRYARSR